MSITKLFFVLATINIVLGNTTLNMACIEDDKEIIQMKSDMKKQRVVSRTNILFEKVKATVVEKAHIIKIDQHTVYCPAEINFLTQERCTSKVSKIKLPEKWVEESVMRNKCQVWRSCADNECDGIPQDYCENPTEMSWMNMGSNVEKNPSSAYFFHRCSRGYQCIIMEVPISGYILDKTKMQIEGDLFKQCILHLNTTTCYNQEGWMVFLREKVLLETAMVTLPCLKGEENDLCWDEEESLDFQLNSEGYSTVENKAYFYHHGIELKHPKEPIFHNSVANLKDVETIYRILQYENLQARFNTLLLEKEINKMREMMISIVYFSLGITQDPLYMFRGIGSKLLGWNKTHLFVQGCIDPKLLMHNIPYIFAGNHSSSILFPQESFSDNEYRRKKFRIETYTEADILRIIENSQGKANGEKRNTVNFDPISNFLSKVSELLAATERYVLWVNFFLTITIVKMLFRKIQV